MNERIKLLAEQAEIKFESHPQHQGIDTAVIIPTDLEKFAELIVREFLLKANGAKIRGESIDELIKNIKEDFGVAE